MLGYRTKAANALAILGASLAFALSACATTEHVEPYRDIACFNRAAVSLIEAVTFAQEARPALVVDAEYNCQRELGCLTGSPGGYDITYFDNGRMERVNVCPVTGTVRPPLERSALESITDADFLFSWPESEMRRGAGAIANAPIDMTRAIGIAEESRGVKAMAAHLKTENGKTYYAIELVEQGRIHIALIDPADGRVAE